ncbi:hypothetical protein ES705_30616 [subsurface metagenome]
MEGYNDKMKIDILRACGFGRKAAKILVDDAATDEVLQTSLKLHPPLQQKLLKLKPKTKHITLQLLR